jgi:hypothetical protein
MQPGQRRAQPRAHPAAVPARRPRGAARRPHPARAPEPQRGPDPRPPRVLRHRLSPPPAPQVAQVGTDLSLAAQGGAGNAPRSRRPPPARPVLPAVRPRRLRPGPCDARPGRRRRKWANLAKARLRFNF